MKTAILPLSVLLLATLYNYYWFMWSDSLASASWISTILHAGLMLLTAIISMRAIYYFEEVIPEIITLVDLGPLW
jgi:hypothetical protein